MGDVISKAELARELDLSRARISQLCKLGLPVRPDGKLNRTAAVEWVNANVCPWLGGWWGNLRQKHNTRTGRRRALMPAASIAGGRDVADFPDAGERGDVGELREAVIIDFMNDLRRTENIEGFARAALRFGCSMRGAYALAWWFDMFIATYVIPEDMEQRYIQVHEEPNWSSIAKEAGTNADVEAWRDWMKRLLEEDASGRAIFKPRTI